MTEQDIINEIVVTFPDFSASTDDNLTGYLSEFTNYLGDVENKQPDKFILVTEKVCVLLNKIYPDLAEGLDFALQSEVLEFYAGAESRQRLAEKFLKGAPLAQLNHAKDTVDYWKRTSGRNK